MTTRYLVISEPLYSSGRDDKNATTVEVLFGWEGEFLRVRAPGHGERVVISTEQGVRFLEAMEALRPEELSDVIEPPPGEMDAMDGFVLHGRIQKEDGTRHTFSVASHYLPCAFAARQWAFLAEVLRLAQEVVRLPETIQWVEHLLMRACLREAVAPSTQPPRKEPPG